MEERGADQVDFAKGVEAFEDEVVVRASELVGRARERGRPHPVSLADPLDVVLGHPLERIRNFASLWDSEVDKKDEVSA